MRQFFLITVLLAACLVASSPVPEGQAIVLSYPNRFSNSQQEPRNLHGRLRRYADRTGPVKRKGSPPEYDVRKGEYICGNKVCKLKPGEKTCNGCQYPIAPF